MCNGKLLTQAEGSFASAPSQFFVEIEETMSQFMPEVYLPKLCIELVLW